MARQTGYSRRLSTAADMLASGADVSDIMERLGTSAEVTRALVRDARREPREPGKARLGTPPQYAVLVAVSIYAVQQLRRDAARRDVSVERLIADLVDVIARDGLVTAVLGEIGDGD